MNRLRLALRVLVKGEAALPHPVSDVMRQLIVLRDSVQSAAADLDGPGRQALNAAAGQLAQIMSSEQVVPIEDSGAFDARRHNAVASMPTGDKALEYQVASSVRSGYLSNGALIRRQDVVVYRFTDDSGQAARE